jgi:hypothetical protein
VGAVDTCSLILIPPRGFLANFLVFFDGVGLAVAFRLPARVLSTSSSRRVTVGLAIRGLGRDWDVTLKAGGGKNETVESLHTNNQGIRSCGNKKWLFDQGALPSPF